jgi:hypothetical protein
MPGTRETRSAQLGELGDDLVAQNILLVDCKFFAILKNYFVTLALLPVCLNNVAGPVTGS